MIRGKWQPGHYVFIGSDSITEKYILNNFKGVQKAFQWKDLEPEKGRYDFSAIKRDLDYLGKHGKYLVIQLQYKGFGKGQSIIPAYVQGEKYCGSPVNSPVGALNSVLWNQNVSGRIAELIRALGREFDSHPHLAAINLPETATGYRYSNPQLEAADEEFALFVSEHLRHSIYELSDSRLGRIDRIPRIDRSRIGRPGCLSGERRRNGCERSGARCLPVLFPAVREGAARRSCAVGKLFEFAEKTKRFAQRRKGADLQQVDYPLNVTDMAKKHNLDWNAYEASAVSMIKTYGPKRGTIRAAPMVELLCNVL
jgi:hypothetical protein